MRGLVDGGFGERRGSVFALAMYRILSGTLEASTRTKNECIRKVPPQTIPSSLYRSAPALTVPCSKLGGRRRRRKSLGKPAAPISSHPIRQLSPLHRVLANNPPNRAECPHDPRSAAPMQRVHRSALLLSNPRLLKPSPLLLPGRRSVAASHPPDPTSGTGSPSPSQPNPKPSSSKDNKNPFTLRAGYALHAKRPPRPFPPPFTSHPSSSFSDPLSTHDRALDRRATDPDPEPASYHGERIRGVTNGDDAVLAEPDFVAVADGVGAWATRERGHAGLWSRLMCHFWAGQVDGLPRGAGRVGLARALQAAYELTKGATGPPEEWFGTTTVSGALLHYAVASPSSSPPSRPCSASAGGTPRPLVTTTQLGDSQILILRPSTGDVIHRTEPQWHWFDCPRQLGTNSPDEPDTEGVSATVEVREGDVVLAMSDGVGDNLWEWEVVGNVVEGVKGLRKEAGRGEGGKGVTAEDMRSVATGLVKAARSVATDPFAESPFMERAVEEGLPTEGGKLDDISVVAAMCLRRDGG